MIKTSVIALAAFLLTTGTVVGNDSKTSDSEKQIAKEVKTRLSGFTGSFEKDLTAIVLFTVNKDNEFVVLSVRTDDRYLENFVKARLNYYQIRGGEAVEGRRYTIPIKITA